MDFTVVLTTYNQSDSEIIFSLSSIIYQQGVSFEVIIADDSSDVDPTNLIDSYLGNKGFSNYKIVRLKENLQTVRNIRNALRFAAGKYVKVICAGDALHDQYVLRDIFLFCERNNVQIGFGRIGAFRRMPGHSTECACFNAPMTTAFYSCKSMNDELLNIQLTKSDWIPAGAQFFRLDIFKELIYGISDALSIRYCEDFALTLALTIESARVVFFDRCVLWYEWGVGISTSCSKESVKRMYADHRRLFEGLSLVAPYGSTYPVARILFRAKELIALKSPIYNALRMVLVNKYFKKGYNEFRLNDFFWLCCADSANEK